jgi:hypothetical protein
MVLLAVASVIACSSGAAKSLPPTSGASAPSVSSTTSRSQLEATILSRWIAAERASVAAAKDPSGPEVLLLENYYADPALSFLRGQYDANARDGLVAVGDIDPGQPRLVNMGPAQAVIFSCATNRLQLIFKATGKPVAGKSGDATPTPNGIRATMDLAPSGVWKVTQSTVKDGSCDAL